MVSVSLLELSSVPGFLYLRLEYSKIQSKFDTSFSRLYLMLWHGVPCLYILFLLDLFLLYIHH